MRFRAYVLFALVFVSCQDEKIKKFKVSSAEVIDVSSKITDLETEQIMANPTLAISGDYLIVSDFNPSTDRGIYLYDKNSLAYLGTTGIMGEGPGQISRYGMVAVTPNGKEFWMSDFEKIKMFKFDIDSVLMDENYLPTVSKPFEYDFFLSRYKFVSDSLALGTGLEVLSPSTFRASLGKWNINTGKIEKFGDEHPNLLGERSNAFFDYSYKHNIMALSHINHDILTLYNADGTIKYHILGEKEFDNENRKLEFFGEVHIGDKYIFTSYLGSEGFELVENQGPKSVSKSKILTFDLDGNLLKVIETGHEIRYFGVDDENKRILCYFLDREVPIGYFYYE
ncbi:BF3164 family lipoprotein [Algoriphagus sp.]|uniref:BF3164 family lipoprotein n=1 Tax=Algoriphagus sp. TaxID=1872435 RepID=UPI003F70D79A